MDKYDICDSDYNFMSLVWDNEPIRSTLLANLAVEKLGWKKSTAFVYLGKLCDRGQLQNKGSIVTSLINREDVQNIKSKKYVNDTFHGSISNLFSAYTSTESLSDEEIRKLQDMISNYRK